MATPYTTTCGLTLTSVDGTDCIGDSRNVLNSNDIALANAVCSLSSQVLSAVDSNTIDLSFVASTRNLSADVKSDSIRYSHLASWQTLSASPTLSAEAVQPRVAKAWVTFNGAASPVPTIHAAFNVSSITDRGTGLYTVNYITPISHTTYAVSSQCDTAGAFTWVFIDDSTYNLTTSTRIRTAYLYAYTGYDADSIWISHTVLGY